MQPKKQESLVHSREQNKSTENVPEETEILDLLNTDFKVAFVEIFKELKEDTDKDRRRYEQNGNVNKEKFKKEPQGNSGAEKYNDCDGRCLRGVAERPEPGGEGTASVQAGWQLEPQKRGTERKKNDEK